MSRLLKIGLFVAITGSLSIAYIMQTVEAVDAEKTMIIHMYMEDASGLMPESRVRFAGVPVGRVKAISLEEGRAKVSMEVDAEVPLYQDAKAIKIMDSLLGNSAVSLESGSAITGNLLPGGTVTRVESSTAMDRTFSSTGTAAEELSLLIEEFRTFMNSGGYLQLGDLLGSAERTVRVSGDLVEENLRILRSAVRDIAEMTSRLEAQSAGDTENLSAVLENSARLSARLDAIAAANDRELRQLVEEMRKSAESLNAVLSSSRNIAASIERGEGNIGRFVKDEQLYERINRISEDVEGFVDSSIGLDLQLDLNTAYDAGTSAVDTRAGLRLIPGNKPKDYRFALRLPSDGEESNDLLFSAQLARHLGPVSLRGGLIENSGGLGLDLTPLPQLKVTSDLFRFSRPSGPVINTGIMIFPFHDPRSENPLHWLYLSGALRDILENGASAYQLGLGIRFFDNDLKGIAPFVPTP